MLQESDRRGLYLPALASAPLMPAKAGIQFLSLLGSESPLWRGRAENLPLRPQPAHEAAGDQHRIALFHIGGVAEVKRFQFQ